MRFLFIACTFFIVLNSNAQLVNDQESEIDKLFESWNSEGHPGGVLGIMKEGKVYLKAYGMASLDFDVANTEETIFNIASISKQFTAIGIIKLEEQGLLSFDDEIQKYLPTIPYFEQKITIRHLMHHTSGLRSLHGTLEMAGWRGNDPRSTEDLFRLMEKQKDLNFVPGSEYLYCNTGYNFMAQIIENVTGESFITWTKENVFQPLGMNETYIEENYASVVSGNATSYYKAKNGFERAVPFWGYMGSGNAHTNVSDLLIWYNNFNHPTEGWEESFKALQIRDPLNDGKANNYAFGIMMDQLSGVDRIQHGGAIGGYRSFACTYPEKDLSIVLLTNFTSSDVLNKVGEVSNILFDFSGEDHSDDTGSLEKIKLSSKKLKKYENHYWNDDKKFARKVYVKNDTLWYFRSEGNESALLPIGNNQFQMVSSNSPILKFDISNPDKCTLIVGYGKPGAGNFESYVPIEPTESMISEYIGTFYSPELDTRYRIRIEEGELIANQKRLGDLDMKLVNENVGSASWPLGIVIYKRNKENEIIGFYASNGRVRNMWFEKIKD